MTVGQLTVELALKIINGDTQVNAFNASIKSVQANANAASVSTFKFSDAVQNLGIRFQGMQAIWSMASSTFGEFINKFNQFQSAQLGLKSIADFKGIDPNVATQSVQNLDAVKNGLINLGDASTSLKNLLSANFTLEQSVTLLQRLGDAAAFGRQGSLSFGEAVRSATEGIKNGNSILVDNAGITKNLSVMLQEAGFSAQDMMKAGSDASVRMAIFNGILKESQGQLGDTGKLINSSQGDFLKFDKAVNDLKISFGQILHALSPLVSGLASIVAALANGDESVKKFVLSAGSLTAAIVLFNGSLPVSVKLFGAFLSLAQLLPSPLKIIVGVLSLLTAATLAYSYAMTAAAGATTAATAGINLIIAAAVSGGLLLFQGISESTSSFNEEFQKSADNISNLSSRITEIKSNISDLNVILSRSSETTALSADAQAQYEKILESTINKYPGIREGLSGYNSQLEVNIDTVKKLLDQEKFRLEVLENMRYSEQIESINNLIDAQEEEIEKYEELKEKYKGYVSLFKNLSFQGKAIDPSLQENFDELTKELGESQIQVDKLQSSFISLIDQASKAGNLEKVIAQIKSQIQSSQSVTDIFFSSMSAYLGSAISNWDNLAFAIQNANNQMNTGVYGPTVDKDSLPLVNWTDPELSSKVSDIKKMKSTARNESTRKELESQIKQYQDEIDRRSPKQSSRSGHTHTSKKEDDPAESILKTLKQQLEIYKSEKDIKEKLNSVGLSELEIISKINDEIFSGNYNTEQTLKLYAFRNQLQNDLIAANEKLADMEWDSAVEETNIYYETEELKISLIKDRFEKEANLIDIEHDKKLDELNKLALAEDQYRERIHLLEMQRINKQADLKQRLLQENLSLDLQEISLIENKYIREFKRIGKQFDIDMNDADNEGNPEMKKRKQDIADKKRIFELSELKKQLSDEIISLLQSTFSSVVSSVQSVVNLLGIGADTFVSKLLNGLNQAVSIASGLVNIISNVSNLFSLFSLGSGPLGLAAAALPFSSGGFVPGSGDYDSIPARLTPGEFVLKKSAVNNIISGYGAGFLKWLNGGSLFKSSVGNNYNSGGFVSPNNRMAIDVNVSDIAIEGTTLKILLNKTNNKLSRYAF